MMVYDDDDLSYEKYLNLYNLLLTLLLLLVFVVVLRIKNNDYPPIYRSIIRFDYVIVLAQHPSY